MTPQLETNDAAAIDLLLNECERSRESQSPAFSPSSEGVFSRIEPAKKMLNQLDAWTIEDPPEDLIQRTLARIASSPLGGALPTGEGNSVLGPNL